MPFSTTAAADRCPLLPRSGKARGLSIGIAIFLISSAEQSADTGRGMQDPEQPCGAAAWAQVVGAAAQRLCKVGFQSRFMVAAASPESHEVGQGGFEGRRWKVGCR
jgi:hypothetical protein